MVKSGNTLNNMLIKEIQTWKYTTIIDPIQKTLTSFTFNNAYIDTKKP